MPRADAAMHSGSASRPSTAEASSACDSRVVPARLNTTTTVAPRTRGYAMSPQFDETSQDISSEQLDRANVGWLIYGVQNRQADAEETRSANPFWPALGAPRSDQIMLAASPGRPLSATWRT